jgi:hypothetical protein
LSPGLFDSIDCFHAQQRQQVPPTESIIVSSLPSDYFVFQDYFASPIILSILFAMVSTRDARKWTTADALSQDKGAVSDTNFAATSTTCIGSTVDVDPEGFVSLSNAEPPKKKRRSNRPKPLPKQIKPPIEILPLEVLETILSFIDDPRKLLNIVSSVKAFRKAIVRRPDIVITASIYGSESTRVALKGFFDNIRNKSIHIPSTLRLLRVVSALGFDTKNCFFHADIYSYFFLLSFLFHLGECKVLRTRRRMHWLQPGNEG